jgi:hypothetical protein
MRMAGFRRRCVSAEPLFLPRLTSTDYGDISVVRRRSGGELGPKCRTTQLHNKIDMT